MKHAHLLELLYHLVMPAVPMLTDTENAHTTLPLGEIEVHISVPEEQQPGGGSQGQEEKPCTSTDSEHVMMQLFEFIALKLKGGRLGKEITIPPVFELVSSGVKFAPTNGNMSSASTIAFDRKTATLYLPAVTLDGNTEVVLQNLIAFESSPHQARWCSPAGRIVLNHMKKRDSEGANLCNGMSRSVQHSKVPTMDKVIEDVNRYYDGRWRVKTKRFMHKYVLSSWKILTFLAAISILLLTTLQVFSSIYTCF
ncbi:hypothetical protein VPH35_063691 [Triticum aestivum]